ncbi:UvrD-helicase domain-containing protein [Ruania halotolerans]|uniref:UvrD-helicase domain-containing protein n=1 Tax=Ruania halotolerans TaxID=2897773 RepID=UPI001E5C94A2|nr:UvrD-helicase domain-containing protein [Ruania halotolerans]UFU07033.1 UvrD-helicase domain-containing protein [Ruania halotolerans]
MTDQTPLDMPATFDVHGPLPQGTTVLEASAGTGKTFTIAALTARYVAEGVAELRDLMLVTFGRAATSELRDRVRERLVSTERALRSADPAASDDPLVALLADVDAAELDRRRARLARALSQLDAATITTTHGFCQQMLTALGIAADVDPAATFVADVADLVQEVTDDLYIQEFSDERKPRLIPDELYALGRAAVSDHGAELEPRAEDQADLGALRYRLAMAVREETERRKRVGHLMDYDDLLVLLRDALRDPRHGPAAAQRVRDRYRVVMVDEFQDTDPVQWEILRTAFHGHRTLVLIGDPKQAIYAFRGADVAAYLDAKYDAAATATLGTNWRSDTTLLDALHTVLGGAALGHDQITVGPVEAAHRQHRFDGGPALRLRQVTREALGVRPGKDPYVGDARSFIAADTAADIVSRLGHARIRQGGPEVDGAGIDTSAWRELRPGDVAVLTRTNAQAEQVRAELSARGVPAVVSGLSSVFATPAAREWLTLLDALEQPGSHGRASALALTPFIGWDASRLATADDTDRDRLAETVRTWARLLATRGVAALHETVTRGGVAERLMATTTGERRLTDLRHVGEVLHTVAVTEGLGAAALTGWLRRRIREATRDFEEERSRRLETDAAAVQVVTVHASKGLEFGVVYVPFAWDRYEAATPAILGFHADDGRRILHVGGPGSHLYREARERYQREDRGEDLRLLYVALTRARHQVVAHWAPSRNTAKGPLTRVLLGGRDLGGAPAVAAEPGALGDAPVRDAFEAIAGRSGGTIAAEVAPAQPSRDLWDPPVQSSPALAVAHLDRLPDPSWRRASYTALTAAAHHAYAAATGDGAAGGTGVLSEPEDTGILDEPGNTAESDREGGAVLATVTDAPGAPGLDLPSPMAEQPAGAAFGTLVHEVLEYADTTASDLDAELLARCRAASSARVDGLEVESLASALGTVMRTPLGPLAAERTLADFDPADRLSELEFELPLAGGDGRADAGMSGGGGHSDGSGQGEGGGQGDGGSQPPVRAATLRDVADALEAYLDAGDTFAPYPQMLRTLAADPDGPAELRGYLTGSIDAVLRVHGGSGASSPASFLVCDYKTNRLGTLGADLTVHDYRPGAVVEAMLQAHYPLQLLLYLVGLHRYLRWRLRGYDPDVHLGGGLYLFVRGMAGPDTPVGPDGSPYGVLAWRPPAGLVPALSAVLDGARSPSSAGGPV